MSTQSTSSDDSAEDHHFKMKVEFFQYERTSLEAYMENQIHKIQRNDVGYIPTPFKMLPSHNILEFCHHEQTNIPAFDHFTLEIKLMQQNIPPCLYFTATFVDAPKFFPGSTYMNGLYNRGLPSTWLKLDTSTGYLPIPPTKNLTTENDQILATFKISLLLENLSFSTAPFQEYSPVNTKKGNLHFPVISNSHIPQTQTQLSHHHNAFKFPPPPITPPTINPPRLFRRGHQDPDESIHWIQHRQSYVRENHPRNPPTDQQKQLIEEVKKRKAAEAIQSPSNASTQQLQPAHSAPSNVLTTVPTQSVPNTPVTSARPALGNLDPNQPDFLFGTIPSPQTQGATALPPTVVKPEVTFQDQQTVVAQQDATSVIVPQNVAPHPIVPIPKSVPTLSDLSIEERPPTTSVSLSHITEEEISKMTDTADPDSTFAHQEEHDWRSFSNQIPHFPTPLAESEPRYPDLPKNPSALYGPNLGQFSQSEMNQHMANFTQEALAYPTVAPTISVTPSTQTQPTPAIQSQAGNADNGSATKVTVITDKPAEPSHGFIDTFKIKTGRGKNSKRSKSDEPK